MNHIVEELEESLKNLGIVILEKWNDRLTYVIAVRNKEKVFVLCTSRYKHYCHREHCLKMFELTEHIPFDSVKVSVDTDFMSSYVYAVTHSEKCKVNYDKCMSVNQVIHLVNS